MISRVSLAAIGIVGALALAACGGGANTSVSARDGSGTSAPTSSMTTATAAAASESSTPTSAAPSALSGFKAVEYRGLRFQVPDGWPVYDLAQDQTRCVRFDQHAVYLGHAGANQNCPAHVVGRSEAVQVEPIDAQTQRAVSAATASGEINGLSVHRDPNGATNHSEVAAFDGADVVATVTFRDDDALAQKILGTFERAGG